MERRGSPGLSEKHIIRLLRFRRSTSQSFKDLSFKDRDDLPVKRKDLHRLGQKRKL